MVDNLGTSLYGGDTSGESIKPDFEKSGGAADKLSKAENAAAGVAKAALAAKGGGAGAAGSVGGAGGGVGAGGAKNAAKDGLKSGAEKAEANEQNPKGLYNKDGGKDGESNKKSKSSKGMKMAMAAAAPFAILLIFMGGAILFLIGLPILMIGSLDFNMMIKLGYEYTIGILEEVGEYVTDELLGEGEFPSEYASALANNGIDVGQVLANGDFVRTNSYIADAGTRDDLVAAASGFSYVSDDEGELAMLYDGKIIHADEFVAAVESDPVLYAAYSDAADISTKYYYGNDVNEVYKEMGLSRGNFNNWKSTGNYKEDEEKYFEILNDVLGTGSDLIVGGVHDDKPHPNGSSTDDGSASGGTYERDADGVDSGALTSEVAENTQEYIYNWLPHEVDDGKGGKKIEWGPAYSSNATERAANLLNTAVSSNEPYLASSAFIAIEEPIQRARVDGDGPVNQVMNTMTRGKETTYQNVETGANETTKKAILETKNFRATVSDSKYDKEEAQNFGRDRVLKTTGASDEAVIKKTTVGTPGKVNADSVVRNGKDSDSADTDVIARANENIELSQAKNNSEAFQTVVGGNRIIEGGSFLSNTINMHVIGAMPSNSDKIAEYDMEVDKVMARRAEAERATKDPFDVSSPYTFLGSIMHNMATAILGNYGSGLTALSAITSAGDTTGKAVANLTGSVTATGGDKKYTTMSGLNCDTVNGIGAEGDLYCTSHNTPSTKYINYSFDDFKGSDIGGDINEDGTVAEKSGLWEFVHLGMDRYASVGVKNAEVCERWHEINDTTWDKIVNFFSNIVGTYEVCKVETDDNDKDIDLDTQRTFTGAKYSFGTDLESDQRDKNELYSSYMMYNQVRSILTGEKSAVAKTRDEYRAKHPLDNSAAGIVARRSGMTKHEAEIALAYSDYLTVIANYDPSTRFDFTAPVVLVEKPILEKQSDDVALNLYAWYSKETEYSDLRTRNFVV